MKHSPAMAPLEPWVVASSALETSSSGLCWAVQGSMLLVAVDAHFKWPEVHVMKETTAAKTIDALPIMFWITRTASY